MPYNYVLCVLIAILKLSFIINCVYNIGDLLLLHILILPGRDVSQYGRCLFLGCVYLFSSLLLSLRFFLKLLSFLQNLFQKVAESRKEV